jgi:hypothetical protein
LKALRRLFPIALSLFACAVFAANDASAQSYRVRTISIGRATSYLRADRTTAAPRSFVQGLSLRGYDLAGDGSGSTSMYIGVRYGSDFGLPATLRDDPYVDSRWNELSLDAAWVDWKPWHAVTTRIGRQSSYDASGWRNFDGFRLTLSPEIADARMLAEVWGGAEVVHRADDRFGNDDFDVQGLPPNDPYRGGDGPGWIVGSRAGTRLDEASVEVSWTRRQYQTPDQFALGSETFGAAVSLSPTDSVTVASRASYQTVIAQVDHAQLHLAWALPNLASVATIGVEQRVPWFDSGSIWNVFGAQPHQGAYVSYQLDLAPLRQAFEVNGWGRIYHGDVDATDFGAGDDDARALGASLVHRARFAALGLPWSWRGLGSAQWTEERAQGGDQYVGDAQLGAHFLRDTAFLYARGIGAFVTPSVLSRFGQGAAWSGLVGFDWRVKFGTFGFVLDVSHTSWRGAFTAGYVTFEVEQWP